MKYINNMEIGSIMNRRKNI